MPTERCRQTGIAGRGDTEKLPAQVGFSRSGGHGNCSASVGCAALAGHTQIREDRPQQRQHGKVGQRRIAITLVLGQGRP